MDLLKSDLEKIKATLIEVQCIAEQDPEKLALLKRIISTTEGVDAFLTLYADFYSVAADTSKARIRAKPTQLLLDIAKAFRTGNLDGLVI